MRINEQIDQGSKVNQPSKSTLGKGDGSTISSNGTLGAANVFESRPPEAKKLDERVIFDQLKLSSDVSKPAPAPPKRRPNPEKKENVNRRSWKSFMPPNFTEFAERMGASLSEVSEVGASNPSLRDKRDSSAMLAEQPGQPDHGEPMSESLTLEHVSKSSGTAEALAGKQFGADGYGGARDERQALLNAGDSRARDLARARRLPSATWPRARKNFIRGNFNDGHQETLEASESDSTVENVNLSPCLSEELLDTGLDILITSNLREKTESELRFEEDERWVMMEEWEEATLSERGKAVLVAEEKKSCCLADISEEREQSAAPEDGSAPSPGTSLSCPSPGGAGGTCCTEDAAVQCMVEDFTVVLEHSTSATGPELSDTDSVQMFLELEEQCLTEDGGDGAVPVCLEVQISPMDSEGLDPDSAKLALLVVEGHRVPLDISASDSAVVSDLEDFDVTCSSQVLSTLEPLTEPFSERDTLAVTPTDSDGGASPSPVAMAGLGSLLVGEVDPDPFGDTDFVALMPSPGAHPAAGLGADGYPSAPVGWGEDNQDLPPEGPCPGRVSPWQPPAPDTALDELGSPLPHGQAGVEGVVPFRTHHLLPARTEVTSWGVPGLVSEDESADLGSGSRAEGWTRPAESGDVCCGSLLPFHAGSASELGSRAPTAFPVPAEDLPWEMVNLGQGLALQGAAHMEGIPVEVTVTHGGTPAAILQPGDVELLFTPGWGVPCPASPAAPEQLPGTSPIPEPSIPWDFGELPAPPHPLSPGVVAQGAPPAFGDPAVDAEEPPGAATTAVPLMVEELLVQHPPARLLTCLLPPCHPSRSSWVPGTPMVTPVVTPIVTPGWKISSQLINHLFLSHPFHPQQFQKEQVDPLQVKLQQVNGVGQGLIQSAGKNCDVQGLEHDMEEINTRWNTLNKKVAQRVAQLQEALLHCGKFQDALEPLLSWLYKVVKAQIQEQKLLQRLLDDRKATVEMIQAEGDRIAQSAEPADRDKIVGQLESLARRWEGLLARAAARQKQLEDILVLAKQFHETTEPVSDWLSVTEKKLANSEPIGTQTAKIQQQISRHKALEDEIESHSAAVSRALGVGQALSTLSCAAERRLLAERLEALQGRYGEVRDRCCRKAALLEQALANARLFGEEEVEVLNWLAEVEDKLGSVAIKDYKRDVLQKQHADQLALNEEIVNRKKNVDQAIRNGQALLKQTTGEEVLLIQEKLDGIKTRYSDITAASSKALRTLEQARQLATKFQSTHEELTGWMSKVEDELAASGAQSPAPEQIPQFQQRQKELKKEVMEHRLVLDTVNEVSRALLELVPWRAREGLDKLVSDTNERYKLVSDTVKQRVEEIDAAIQRSQQYEQAADAELAWVAETKRKLMALGPIRLEQDQTTAQLQVQKVGSLSLHRHNSTHGELFSQRNEIFGTGREQKAVLQVIRKTESLVQQYEAVSQLNSERYARLERAQVLVNQFWETYEELNPWIEETQTLISQLHPAHRPRAAQAAQLRESIAEHKPHIDKLLKIGPQAEAMYARIKEEVCQRALALDEAVSQSTQFHDKIEPMLETLESLSSRLRLPPLIPAEVDKIRECISDNKNSTVELEKLQPSFEALKRRGEELIGRSQGADKDLAAKVIQDKLDQMVFFWEDIKARTEEREMKFLDVLELAEKFWYDMAALLTTIKDTQDIVHDLESPGIDPSIIKQQVEAAETIKEETDGLHEELEFIRLLGTDLIFACGETEKPEVKKSIDEMNSAWENLNKTWKERLEKLEEAMQAAVLLACLPLIEMERLTNHQDLMAGDDASSLRSRLEKLNACWEAVLQKTEEREQQLQSTLQQAQGFHGEIEEFLLWLTRMESQLSASKPTGGLPETAREQLNAHMELYSQFKAKEEVYSQLLAKGRLMLLSRDDSGSGSKTEQSVALLEQKWCLVSTKMEERKEALALATDFQNSLQDFINWLTLAEQSLNIAPPPSLILAAVLAQIDEHKVFANEVNAHRDRIIELDQTGNQLKFLSQKQDVVLIKNLLVSVQSRWEKVVQRSVERGRALDDARKRAKQFHEAWKKLIDWLEDAENHLDSELEISNDPDKIKLQLSKHKEFQKTLGGKQPVYDTTIRTGRALKEKALLPDDTQKLDNLLGEVRDKWDTVCGKSVERQHKLEEALLFSGQFMDALQALVDWLYKVEPQLAEDQPVHGDLDLVMNLMDAHKVFQKELGKRTGTVQVLKRSGRELIENSRDDTTWVKVQLQELSNRWDTVCKLSVSKQSRLEQALKQAEEFRTAVHMLLEWLSEAEQSLRFRGALPDDAEALQALIDAHKEFMKKVEEKRVDVNAAVAMGEVILGACHPDCITTIKHWITIIRARFEEVLTWAKQHQQRLEAALSELVANAELLEELLAWIQWAETTLIQRDQDPLPQNIEQVKALISEHQSFMEEMTRKQPDVDRVTKTYKRKATEPPHGPFIDKSRSNRKSLGQAAPPSMPIISQSETKNPRINQLSARWQQVWLLALERQRKLNDALDRLEELKEFANLTSTSGGRSNALDEPQKSRVMDFFRRIDKDRTAKSPGRNSSTASWLPVTGDDGGADIFDRDGDGYIDYYEFVAALHPNKDAYRPTTDADKIEDEVTRQVAQCKCAKRFQVEQIGENKYRFFLGNQFGDSQQLRLVRILRSTVMVRVGGGWMALDEFLVKNDPCRARGRTNLELREKFILPEGASQGMTPFRSRGRRSKPSSRAASPTRSSSSASQSNHSCASMPSSPATPASGAKTPHHFSRCYDKPWLINSKAVTPLRGFDYSDLQLPSAEVTPSAGSKLKRPTFHSSRTSLAGDTSNSSSPASTGAKTARADPKKAASRPTSRAGSRTGSRASSRRGSDASDFDLLETQSACSDTSESSAAGGQSSRRGTAKPSKIPTMSKKTPAATPKTPGPKR
uniref:MACF1 n=1 Tax=Malurus cyaneus samueli TaxID=2593467 RepID=A0A8C5UGF2_9PASS